MAANKAASKKTPDGRLKDYLLIVVSGAEPYVHMYEKDTVRASRGTGGVITAMEPILKLNQGLWVAHGRGTADKSVVDENDKVSMPPNKKQYTLKRVWISKKNLKSWYYGFSNETLWPLCHNVFERPVFSESDWQGYKAVNEQFAEAVLKEIDSKKAIVWNQDYQLALVSKNIREKNPDVIIGQFWHIPWPVADTFKICPWDKEILEGMLGNELIGFQRQAYCRNFLNSVSKTLEAKVDFDKMTVTYNNNTTYVRAFPISIDYKSIRDSLRRSRTSGRSFVKQYITGKYDFLSIGVERIDYIKGLPERIKAIDRFLEKYPEYQEKFTHVNILVPSRTLIKRYEELSREIEILVENVNFKYATSTWQPIHVIYHSLLPSQVYGFYRGAHMALVTSLADGMNLVAKEYITAGPDDGALVLSEQAGAADELEDAIIVNPYDIEKLADSIKLALEMPKEERKKRIQKMRDTVSKNNVYEWAGKFLVDLIDISSHRELTFEGSTAKPL